MRTAAYRANDEDADLVADWHNVTPDEVLLVRKEPGGMNFFYDSCTLIRLARKVAAYEAKHTVRRHDDARFTKDNPDVEWKAPDCIEPWPGRDGVAVAESLAFRAGNDMMDLRMNSAD
ncbi:MAG: hypothetical protein ACJ8F7_05295 [Gemmataceae bacterium]